MSVHYILKLESQPNAQGEYLGPYASAGERDDAARQLRGKRDSKVVRKVCFYRVDIDPDLVAKLISPTEAAA